MFKHLFKLIWNKKSQNFLLLIEILVSFMVVFLLSSSVVYYMINYQKPMGMDYKPVWMIQYNNELPTKNTDSIVMFYDAVKQHIASFPEVAEVSFSGNNIPFSSSFSSTDISNKGVKYERISNFRVEDDFIKVWSMNLKEGRWFNAGDRIYKDRPIVINESLKKKMFGDAPATGQLISNKEEESKWRVIGVVEDVKDESDFSPVMDGMYLRIDTGTFKWLSTITLKVNSNADAAFESRLSKYLSNTFKNSSIEIAHLEDMRKEKNRSKAMPVVIFMIVAGFLIINVALGIFGVLWYNINKRKSEIGLRRAIGATGNTVSIQLVSESLLLATLSLILGVFFAVQFPLLHVFDMPSNVYFIAIGIAIIFIYLLVFICSLYPGKQAAGIHPAIALHEE
ncbi:ABC transporter permease [Pedobacter duraquae]|uniref:Putative ABC transport system permease protein n=1 Tax=Pedobacter duraquae TaxID=425511 RepID=A0A4R6IED7_9SPHI|nr:FtsX-like permease family protein [Pedobacter duraquae]TDO20650.1 putative ABC transport system permease protein [Pedobacter duraquae]